MKGNESNSYWKIVKKMEEETVDNSLATAHYATHHSELQVPIQPQILVPLWLDKSRGQCEPHCVTQTQIKCCWMEPDIFSP